MKLKEFKQIKLQGGNKKMTKIKQEKGITLIALVITIVVLLILAGVSVNAIFSDNGIIKRAQDAQNKMDEAQQKDLNSINELNTWIDNQVNGNKENSFDGSTLTIETALNADKYGWKVPGYTTTTTEFTTGVWRLFYQDSEYTYLITDQLVGSYKPINYCSSYTNGSNVSQVGQKLSPTISTLFTASNTNISIKATAWFTDTEKWKSYANNDAVFAIASPTLDLFVASYNATGQGSITLGKGTYGYTDRRSYIKCRCKSRNI